MLAGGQAEDFLLIRDILERNQKVIPPELDRASSQSEAKTLLRRGHSGPVWFEHEMGDAATKLLAEFLQTGCRVPSIVLAELAAEKAVADIIQAGAWDCAEKPLRNGADRLRTIRCTLNLKAMRPKRNSAEDSFRKLPCAVQQSADTIMITDSEGIIEHVNAAF